MQKEDSRLPGIGTGRRMTAKSPERTLADSGNRYLYCGDGQMNAYFCQNAWTFTAKVSEFILLKLYLNETV